MLVLNIEKVCKAKDALTGKEGEGVLLTLSNGKGRFFVWKSLQQFIGMELEAHQEVAQQAPRAETRAVNGTPPMATVAAK